MESESSSHKVEENISKRQLQRNNKCNEINLDSSLRFKIEICLLLQINHRVAFPMCVGEPGACTNNKRRESKPKVFTIINSSTSICAAVK
jgi:hypothetical protein